MILVTGNTGFLGAEIVRRLRARGASVRGVDIVSNDAAKPSDVEIQIGDLTDPEVAKKAVSGATVVIHSAAVQHHTPGCPRFGIEAYMGRNVTMTRNLLAASKAAGVARFVFVSTDMVYGPKVPIPMPVDARREPVGPYGRSKVACEDLCVAARGEMTVAIARPSVILGPGRFGILVKLFEQIRTHRTVWMIGDGRNRHHMVEVGDCAEACILASERGGNGSFNLGVIRSSPTRELIAQVCKLAGSRSSIRGLPAGLTQFGLACLDTVGLTVLNPEQYLIAPVDYVLDIEPTRRALGWTPESTDVEALFATYRHYLKTEGFGS